MTLEEKIQNFDPDGVGLDNGNLFGLPFTPDEAKVCILPVPWDVTVSYQAGCANGPAAILKASSQLDLYDESFGEIWKCGIALEGISDELQKRSTQFRVKAEQYIKFLEDGGQLEEAPEMQEQLSGINHECETLNKWVENYTFELLETEKLVGLIGGDHSTPLGFIRALARKYDDFGILQIDAHADLREAYEGFEYSHASIMHNALKIPQVTRLLQVGIRDMAISEQEYAQNSDGRIEQMTDRVLKMDKYSGGSWFEMCTRMVETLPEHVYISFDIDGLDPALCPNTGTPVPGGLQFEEAMYLLHTLGASGRKVIGFDLVEVAPGIEGDEWDGNVGARILYRLIGLMAKSWGIL